VIAAFRGTRPRIDASAWVAEGAVVVGDVVIGAQSSVWFHAVVRGDVFPIRIGARTNLQDNVTVHVTGGRFATTVGDDVTVGHGAILHACTIADRVLIGMGAIVLDDAVIEPDCLVGAGALVPPGARIPSGRLVLGNPARVVRELTPDERAHLLTSAANYVALAGEYQSTTSSPRG
jgi:carbonic anhydrase/acetyltransferase-like protein (isoleucine patch superfamily)